MTLATLRALHAIIGTAIDDIERVYRERSPNNLVHYPSLDEPYYTTTHHTPEEELADSLKSDAQPSTTAQFSSAIRFLEAAHVVEILRKASPGGLHVRDILRLVLELRTNLKTAAPPEAVPLTPAHLGHILRLLAMGHYLREVKPDMFASNRTSSYIDSGKTVSQLGEAPETLAKYKDMNGIAAYVGLAYVYWRLGQTILSTI